MSFVYLGALLVAIAGSYALDYRHKLALSVNRKYICPILVGVVFFLAWDIAGINLGIFFRGQGELLSGILLGPELPLEEVFFLFLLNYNGLLLIRAALRRWPA